VNKGGGDEATGAGEGPLYPVEKGEEGDGKEQGHRGGGLFPRDVGKKLSSPRREKPVLRH